MGKPSNHPLGYLCALVSSEGPEYSGGLLVVTEEGFPVEFRCTEVIRPGRMQFLLYGGSLKRYVMHALIGTNLYGALESGPEVLLVDTPEFLSLGGELPIPVVLLEPPVDGGPAMPVDPGGDVKSFDVHFPDGGVAAATVAAPNADNVRACQDALARCSRRMDICEPFSRIRAVLTDLERRSRKA